MTAPSSLCWSGHLAKQRPPCHLTLFTPPQDKLRSGKVSLKRICSLLVDMAYDRGSDDNITVLIVVLTPQGKPAAAAGAHA